MKKETIKCKICQNQYLPDTQIHADFRMCHKCCDKVKQKIDNDFKIAIRQSLERDFNSEYEATKFVWENCIKK